MDRHSLASNEDARLSALRTLRLLDMAPSKAFDRITRMASQMLRMPIALIFLIDRNVQHFKSRVGFDMADAPRDQSPCNWTLGCDGVLTIADMREDDRFSHTPMVQHGGILAYAGAPLVTRSGYPLGTLCVMDRQPRSFDDEEIQLLSDLADMVMGQIELQNSIGRIHAVSGYPNEYQLFDDLDGLASVLSATPRAALLVELMPARQMRSGLRVFGSSFVENLMHGATDTIRRALGEQMHLYHVGAARCVVLLDEARTVLWQEVTRQLHLKLREPIDCGGVPIRAEPAIGLHTFVTGGVRPRDILRRLYSAVDDARSSRELTAAYDEHHDARHARRFQLLAGLAVALQADDQLSPVFQPRVGFDGIPMGAEALLRWRDPVHGDVSPAEFVPLAEETALIGALTRWVLERALTQLARLRNDGYRLTVSINVSASNLEEPEFASEVSAMLSRHGVPPDAIELEFTESVLARDDGRVIEQLSALRDMGIEIAIDDFGTGYSSLAYLQKLPAGVLNRSCFRPRPCHQRARPEARPRHDWDGARPRLPCRSRRDRITCLRGTAQVLGL